LTNTHRRKGTSTTEAAIGVIQPKAEGCQQPPEAGRGKGQIPSLRPPNGTGSADSDFGLLAFRTVKG
jgi:hypothetical protein